MTLYDTTLDEAPARTRLRDLLAALLHVASRALDRLAIRLAAHAEAPPPETDFEFHAEAGAPEGALYVNGRLLGHLPGVTRL